MTSTIKFIDANIFIRRWSDPAVEHFINFLEPEEYCTSVLVLIEAYHHLQKRNFTGTFGYLRTIMGTIKVYDIIQDDLFSAIKNPLPIRINDRIHIAVMKRNNIQTIISYDTDFDKEKEIRREEV